MASRPLSKWLRTVSLEIGVNNSPSWTRDETPRKRSTPTLSRSPRRAWNQGLLVDNDASALWHLKNPRMVTEFWAHLLEKGARAPVHPRRRTDQTIRSCCWVREKHQNRLLDTRWPGGKI